MFDPTNRHDFLRIATLFEGSLIVAAAGLGVWFGIHPMERLTLTAAGFIRGCVATLPMFALFAVTYRWPMGPLRRIKQTLLETLGPSLAVCRWHELMLLAAVAGISEELLFRGVLQIRLGLFGSNLLFGIAHSVSPMYVVLAGGMGLYLGWLFQATGNLLAPIVAHALYDFLAFLVVARDCRRRGTLGHPPADSTLPDETTPASGG